MIWNTGDQAGSGKITGGSRTVKGSKATAKGTVSVNGNLSDVGMKATASFSKGNTRFVVSCKL